MEALQLPFLAVLPALAIVAGLKDLTSMKIPNWISGLLILGFFPALLIGMALFALRLLGGGDVKLMAAACLWLGAAGSGVFVLATAAIGGLFCLALILARTWLRPYLADRGGWLTRLMEPKGDIPYGVAIAAGVLVAWPASPLMVAFLAA